ncbi:MAG: imidazoleglycerol-phosphate dehydratase HisB [Oscillospiraceae bacterium]
MRSAHVIRATRETDIDLTLYLDGGEEAKIETGIGFFDHMLTALALHGGLGLSVHCKGDLRVDCHHTVEDIGIVLGQAFAKSLGDKAGIARFGNVRVPMDEALAEAVVDISGRPYLVFDAAFTHPSIGEMETQMVREFWYAFAMNAGITLHLSLLYGDNDHHKAEALFKAAARALREAVRETGGGVLSTKGVLNL